MTKILQALLATPFLAAAANAQNTLHYWDFESMTDVVGGVATTAVGTPDLSLNATYGEAYSGANQSLNSVSGGLGSGGGHLDADVFDGVMATALDYGTSNFSFSYWSYNPDDGDVRGPRVFDCLELTSEGFQLGTEANGFFNLRLDDDLGGETISGPAESIALPLDAWFHVAVNVDRANSQWEAFFDGVSQGVFSLGNSPAGSIAPTMDMNIGVINGGTNVGQSQEAGLDDLAFYDDLLSPVQVMGLANATLTPLSLSSSGGNYCVAAVNDTGSGATISMTGSTSIAANDLVLHCGPVGANQPGIFFFSDTPAASPIGLPFGEGRRCAVGAIVRLLPPVFESGGDLSRPVDYNSLPSGASIMSGDTLYFQGWYRDTMDNNNDGTASGFNLSDGLELTFQP